MENVSNKNCDCKALLTDTGRRSELRNKESSGAVRMAGNVS